MIGRVRAMGKGGRGIISREGKPVFLDGVIEGELVEFSIREKKHSVWSGSLNKIIEASKDRVPPPCSYYGRCGGCNFQHIAYPRQVAFKKAILINNLKKISRIRQLPRIAIITSPQFHYRTRVTLKVQKGKIGFFQKGSYKIIEVKDCPILPESGEVILQEMGENPIIQKTDEGEIALLNNGKEYCALLKAGQIHGYLSEKEKISFSIRGFSYWVKPDNFIQSNRFTLDSLIGLVEKKLGNDLFSHTADLFSGIGFFTLPLSRQSERVTAVDIDQKNIRSLQENLRVNGIVNVAARETDIRKCPLPRADLYLLDPPRMGLGLKIIRELTKNPPKKILYFSCDSATFARDLSVFAGLGYPPKDITIIDNFPQTDHFEIFTCL